MKYFVTGTITISVHVTVEAKSKAEAIRIAHKAPMMTFCHQCANGVEDEWSTSGELDGTVDIRPDGVEECENG